MRMLMKASIPVEAGNNAVLNGSMGQVLESTLAAMKPEAAYFCTDSGVRTMFVVFDLKDACDLPALIEPLFMRLNARVEVHPAMTQADLKAGLQKIADTAFPNPPGWEDSKPLPDSP